MKQYRLKITWSNGDSELVGKAREFTDEELEEGIKTFNQMTEFLIDGKQFIIVSHVRKFEFEEIKPKACHDCIRENITQSKSICGTWPTDIDPICSAKDPKHLEKF